jgi:serine/threonine-protein kinase
MKKIPIKREDILVGILVAVLFILPLLFQFSLGIFESLERVIYGVEMRLDAPRNVGQNRIAIVNIDNKSIAHLGPWPWPRRVIADMITILKNNGAKLIGLDLLFSNREQNQGLTEVRDLHEALLRRGKPNKKDAWILNRLEEIEKSLDNDKILSHSVKESGNIILPVVGSYGGYDTELVLAQDSFVSRNSLRLPTVGAKFKHIASVNQLTTPFAELSENSHGLGHINDPPLKFLKGQVHLLFINYRGHIIPSMAFRMAANYLDKRPEQVLSQGKRIQLAVPIIPTPKGEIFIKFKGARRSFPYYSFVDILKVKKVPAVFSNKIVLLGYTAEGAPTINTPVDPEMPRVELTANIIDDLMTGRYLRRPDFMKYVEGLILLLLSLFASIVQPRLSFVNRTGATLGLLFLVLMIGILSFTVLNVWLKTLYIGLSLVTIYVVTSVREIFARQKQLGLRESIETNRMLGLSFQSQGLLDLAFEKFRKIPLDDAMKDVIYNLGLDYERKRMINKAISVYEYITQKDQHFRDLNERMPKLKKVIGSLALGGFDGKKEDKIVVSDDLEIRPTVGRYEVIEELGQGAMGIVYKAKDPKINRLLAIKTIRFSDEFEEDRLQDIKDRFFREAQIAGKLSHPSIVAVYDVGEDFDLSYLAMEFLNGENLQKYCRKGSLLPLRKVLYILAETARALDYAHAQGVIHRDIKPANIMVLKDGKVKVTDFGIAKAVSDSQTKSGIVLGTPNYMSPEQINGQELDGRSDIFSVGVVFYELLTGQLPFRGKTLANLFYQITQGRHPSPRQVNPRVPKPCEQMIDKALAKNPNQRFRSAGEFAKYLRVMIAKIDQLKAGNGKA